MARVTVNQLAETLERLQAEMAEVSRRLEGLEARNGGGRAVAAVEPVAAAPAAAEEPVQEALSEEQLLAIAAAIGAYLGVRVHIRQIRLVSSSAWSQQGRVSIQASHSLHG
jgi:methylmalonyl-CoA carboxyltransferase large subunit